MKRESETSNFKEGLEKFFKVIWIVIFTFLKIVWKIIKFILKYILFPFWYTGVLVVKSFKFLRIRNNQPLSDEDKNYLSLIPTLFFMVGICIVIIYLLFYFNVFEETKQLIEDQGFWAAIGQWFIDLGLGIWWLINVIFVDFLWGMIIVPFSTILNTHDWVSAVVLLAVVVIGSGLIILIYNLIKKGKFIKIIKNFLGKIKNGIIKVHEAIKSFVLKYLIGKKYIETRTKNFFWTNVFLQFLVTIVFFVFSIVIVINNYIKSEWTTNDILRFASFAGAILFVGVGIFATWFFSFVHGVSSSPTEVKKQNY